MLSDGKLDGIEDWQERIGEIIAVRGLSAAVEELRC